MYFCFCLLSGGLPNVQSQFVSYFQQPALEEEHPSRTPSPRGTPLATPAPTPEYTPPESEESAHESEILATPERTLTPSVTSEEPTLSDTREEEQAVEPIKQEVDKEEQTSEQVCLLFDCITVVRRQGLRVC